MVRMIENCRAVIPTGEDDESLRRCGSVAEAQCEKCSEWFCANEESPHLEVCVRCGHKYCAECHAEHRLTRACDQPLFECAA